MISKHTNWFCVLTPNHHSWAIDYLSESDSLSFCVCFSAIRKPNAQILSSFMPVLWKHWTPLNRKTWKGIDAGSPSFSYVKLHVHLWSRIRPKYFFLLKCVVHRLRSAQLPSECVLCVSLRAWIGDQQASTELWQDWMALDAWGPEIWAFAIFNSGGLAIPQTDPVYNLGVLLDLQLLLKEQVSVAARRAFVQLRVLYQLWPFVAQEFTARLQ